MSTLPLQINERTDWVSQNNMKLNLIRQSQKKYEFIFPLLMLGPFHQLPKLINYCMGVIISENLK